MGRKRAKQKKASLYGEAKPVLSAFTVADRKDCRNCSGLLNSGLRYGLEIEPLGLGTAWRGGDMFNGPGGGQKINPAAPGLATAASGTANAVRRRVRYHNLRARRGYRCSPWNRTCNGPLFAAEVYCWPDKNRIDDYPQIDTPYRFLNSGAFIGKAGDLLGIVEDSIDDHADDQLYYTERFLSGKYNNCS